MKILLTTSIKRQLLDHLLLINMTNNYYQHCYSHESDQYRDLYHIAVLESLKNLFNQNSNVYFYGEYNKVIMLFLNKVTSTTINSHYRVIQNKFHINNVIENVLNHKTESEFDFSI